MSGSKNIVRRLVLIVCVLSFYLSIKADIVGKIQLDTTKWAPVAYLSIIPDFSQMNTISFSNIIEQSSISEDGVFKFQTQLLPEENSLYRIHISKFGDPPASLIIGGRNNNHFFLFAKKDIYIQLKMKSNGGLFQDLIMEGYNPNTLLFEINKWKRQLDSFDYFGITINSEFAKKSIYNEMRYFADTCSIPLVSLYAIYQSNYKSDYLIQPEFYNNYLNKWKSEESLYFDSFRKQLGYNSGTNWTMIGIVSLILFLVIALSFLLQFQKRTRPNLLSKHTLQERRIYFLLKESNSNKEMASELSISLSTVKSHVNNIYSKLGVSSRKEILDHKSDSS